MGFQINAGSDDILKLAVAFISIITTEHLLFKTKEESEANKWMCFIVRDNGLAENVFHSLDSPAAYSTLLQGMTRFFQVDQAWRLYQETQERGIALTRDAFNSLIRVVCYLREGNEHRWQLIQVNGSYHYTSVSFISVKSYFASQSFLICVSYIMSNGERL